jgi:uncharacterized SAM-binding protein YcdF (DUF218 family)
MGFVLKKIVGYWLMPLPFAMALITIGLVLRLLGRAPRLRRGCVVFGVGWLALLSNNWVGTRLIQPLESAFPPVPELLAGQSLPAELAACGFVVVLGSGHADATGFSANNELSASGLARIVEGVRILRALPEAKLIVSGPGKVGSDTHADVLARAAVALGIGPERIIKIDTARDTEDEANAVRKIVGIAPVALITSAWHLPRAVALCRHVGLHVLPCPADFTAPPKVESSLSDYLGWDAAALQRSSWAVRERIGWLWIWLRGRTTPDPALAGG